MTVPRASILRSAPPTARAALNSAIGAGEFAESRTRTRGLSSLADAPQRRIERRLEAQLVVELQLADDALDAIERRLVVDDRHHANPVGFARGGG